MKDIYAFILSQTGSGLSFPGTGGWGNDILGIKKEIILHVLKLPVIIFNLQNRSNRI